MSGLAAKRLVVHRRQHRPSDKMPAMKRRTLLQAAPFLPATLWAASQQDKDKDNPMPSSKTVYELRVYHAAPGKLA
jgi:hypothetical protein